MIGLMVVLVLSSPAFAQEAPSRVVIEVSDQNPVVAHQIEVTVRVYDPEEPARLFDPVNPDSLIEFRKVTGAELPGRSPMYRVSEGVYTTNFAFFHEGPWQIVALPDLTDRSLLPPRSTPQVTLEVRNDVPRDDGSINMVGTIAFLVLIAGGVIIAILAGPWLRRPKGQAPSPPAGHDTWWASP
jgi:hypothetical protein